MTFAYDQLKDNLYALIIAIAQYTTTAVLQPQLQYSVDVHRQHDDRQQHIQTTFIRSQQQLLSHPPVQTKERLSSDYIKHTIYIEREVITIDGVAISTTKRMMSSLMMMMMMMGVVVELSYETSMLL